MFIWFMIQEAGQSAIQELRLARVCLAAGERRGQAELIFVSGTHSKTTHSLPQKQHYSVFNSLIPSISARSFLNKVAMSTKI